MHLKGYDYNKVLSVFYISYIIFEIPSNMACKWIGPGWFIPGITLGFGILSICTAFCHDIATVSAVRFLLGIFEAGMLPGKTIVQFLLDGVADRVRYRVLPFPLVPQK